MDFSIIIPSFNQEKYIRETLKNVSELKSNAHQKGIAVEILLFDNESKREVQNIISDFRSVIDYVEVKKDNGQFDAINKGIDICKGAYWTWLNTDDLIDIDGFLKEAEILKRTPSIEYIYGDIDYIDNDGKIISRIKSNTLELETLINKNPGIYQPGSFFKTSFTQTIGKLKSYRCCFDYEYVLRALKKKAVIYRCDFPVAQFRYYKDSKTGSITPVFIKEQLSISSDYGRTKFSFLTFFLNLRLLKHKLFPRR